MKSSNENDMADIDIFQRDINNLINSLKESNCDKDILKDVLGFCKNGIRDINKINGCKIKGLAGYIYNVKTDYHNYIDDEMCVYQPFRHSHDISNLILSHRQDDVFLDHCIELIGGINAE